MAAYAALVSLLNNIHTITNHPRLSTALKNKHVQPLLEKTDFLLNFIEGYNYGGGSKEAQDLERQIASAAHAAEDVIESHIVDKIHEGRSEASVSFSLDLHQIILEMDAIMEKTTEFKEKREFISEKSTQLVGPLVESGKTAMVGLDALLIQLLDELTGYQSSRRITSIVGMGGSGKTTLAKHVYENLLIKEHFQFRAWATISQQNNAQEVLSTLLLGLGKLSNGTIDDLGMQLHKTLSGRRYLMILDDIWSVKAWDEVKRYLPDNRNGSRILLTTRLSNVAKDCGSSRFMMNLLDEENSWKLFCGKTFQNGDCPTELREVGAEIVKSCKGLALSIVVIGGFLLKSPRNVGFWKEVAKHLKLISNTKEKQESLDVLSLSYNHLPPHLKPCFLYLGVFKEDSEICISEIIKLWIAEGFIKPIGVRVLEDIAEGYLKDLIDRNLILVGRHRKNGKLRSIGVHDLLRDLCIKLARQEDFYHVRKGGIQGKKRCLVVYGNIKLKRMRHPLTRSIVARGYVKQPVRYRLLRVLHQSGYTYEGDYYGNVNLRYLICKHPFNLQPVWKLPTSMSLIWNLQTLIIEIGSFSLLIVAPPEFWKMRQIRHVDCHRIYVPSPPSSKEKDGITVLENLQTLKTTVNLKLCKEIRRIIPNVKKLHLVYEPYFRRRYGGEDDSLMESLCYLDRLHKLESLNLKIYGGWLSKDKKLPTSFPSSLNKLSLSHCKLEWEVLSVIDLLPQLEVLKLKTNSFTKGNWILFIGQFRRLKFLKIHCCDLVKWDADESHFPVLQKLILIKLYYLEEIPLSIGDIPTLQFIGVRGCSASAAVSAVKIKEDQLENDDLQVQVRVNDTNVESFKEKLETEGLTTDNIQLDIW